MFDFCYLLYLVRSWLCVLRTKRILLQRHQRFAKELDQVLSLYKHHPSPPKLVDWREMAKNHRISITEFSREESSQ